MKLRSIKFENHPVLAGFELDFLSNGGIKDISLLVGENGCGKTIFLEEVHKVLTSGITLWNDGIDREITIEFSENEVGTFDLPAAQLRFSYQEERGAGWQRIHVYDSAEQNVTNEVLPMIQRNENSLNQAFKCIYSTVEINFEQKNIDSVRATEIDSEEVPKQKSTASLATEIAQLLIDIKAQDDSERAAWLVEHQGQEITVPELPGRFERFAKAYGTMFDGKELVGTKVSDGRHNVIFKDTKRDVEFDGTGLSSGEKQVVYRAGFILRVFGTLDGGVVLIDEPELSLHPKWQAKYIQFLRDIFLSVGDNNVQFIIATHSPILLKSCLDEDVSVFMFTRGDDGAINVKDAYKAGFGMLSWSPTWGEICYFAFKMCTPEFHEDLYSSLQIRNSTSSITATENWLVQNGGQTKEIVWNENGQAKEETLMTSIRNKLHHPDNANRPGFSEAQLCDSINRMTDLH